MILFFYILKDYLKYVIGTIFLSVFLFDLFDFLHKTTKYFSRFEPSAELLIKFYLYKIPMQVVQAMPIASLLASVICMILLNRSNEITAMRAAGMGPLRIGSSLIAGGLLLSIISLGTNEYLVPIFATKMHYVQQVEIEGRPDDALAEGARWIRDERRMISFRDYNPIARVMTGIKIVEFGPDFRPEKTREASLGRFLGDGERWLLEGVRDHYFRANGDLDRRDEYASLVLDLPLEPKKLKKERREENELSMAELRELIGRGEQAGADVLPFKVEFHSRMAYPFAAFVVSLIGLKFGYRSERTTETVMAIMLAFSIGMSYWFIFSWTTALGKQGDLPPLLSAWAANFLILSFVFLDYWRSQRP